MIRKLSFLVASILTCISPFCLGEVERPNLIIILVDDMGYADLSGFGAEHEHFQTPNISRLIDGGVKCTQGYVSAPVCSPSRAGLVTGRYQTRFGHETNLPPQPRIMENPRMMGLPLEETTLATALKKQGYYTGLIGKWHLGELKPYHPCNRGFDEFYGHLRGHHSYWDNFPDPIYRNFDPVTPDKYLTEEFTDEAISFVSADREQPFFLYLSYNAVHTPMHAKDQDLEHFPAALGNYRKRLAAMTLSLDRELGRLFDAMEAQGLMENSLIFFLSDNGGVPSENTSDNTPLRGSKGTLAEGGIRVPFIVHWRNVLPEGGVYNYPVSALDIFPTFLAASGAEREAFNALDGVDLIPYLKGSIRSRPHQEMFWHYRNHAAIRIGDMKMIRLPDRPAMLFDLSKDISESDDLADQYPELVKELYHRLFDWESQMEYQRWSSDPKYNKIDILRYDQSYLDARVRELNQMSIPE